MTLTIELPEAARVRLEADAQAQGRPVADIAAERLAALYAGDDADDVGRLNSEGIAAVERGLADMDAGRTIALEDYEAAVASRRVTRNGGKAQAI